MSDNGDPDNFADVLLGCNSIKTGSNAARWCDKGYDGLVQKAKLTSDPATRRSSMARRKRSSISRRRGLRWQTGKRSMLPAVTSRVQREPDGQRFFKSKTELTGEACHIWMRYRPRGCNDCRKRDCKYERTADCTER
jgi:hypothetical protein